MFFGTIVLLYVFDMGVSAWIGLWGMSVDMHDNVSVSRVPDKEETASGFVSAKTDGASAPTSAPRSARTSIFGRAISGISGAVHSVGAHVARALPTTSARVIATVACVGAVAVGGTYVATTAHNDAMMETVVWVDDDEPCVNYVQEAAEELGYGENQIDATWNGHGVGIYATREFDLCHPRVGYHGLTSPYCFPTGSSQAVVQDAWVSAGAKHDEQGFCKIGDCYLIACTSVFGEVGDKITFYFDDGSHIDTIKIDAKAEEVAWYDPTPATKWGHDDGRCVLEFCGEDRIGDEPYQTLGKVGRHTVSWTNHGKGVNVGSEMGGSIGGADLAATSSANGVAASAIEDCQAKPNFDNSTLAAALISYSYSQRREQPDSEVSTALYEEVCTATLGADDYCASYHFHSCDRGVAAAVRWTGADINFPAGACDAQFAYCHESPLWEVVVEGVSIDGDDDWAESVGLQPGDVGISDGEHTLAYVGNEAVLEGYEQFIKGNDGTQPGTGGDIGEPASGAAWVMASAHERGAGIQNDIDGRPYTFFRYVGDYPDADKFEDVGSRATIAGGQSVKGTPCECVEECDGNQGLGMDLAWLCVQMAGVCSDLGEASIFEPTAYPWTAPSELVSKYGESYAEAAEKLKVEDAIGKETLAKYGGNKAYASCNQAACMAIAAVVDMDVIPATPEGGSNSPGRLLCYLHSHPQYFTKVNATSEADLEPGDILVKASVGGVPAYELSDHPDMYGWDSPNHTAIYVGNELAQKKYPGTKGNVFQAGYSGTYARYPQIDACGWDFLSLFEVYRPKAHNDNAQFPDVDYKKLAGSWSLPKGTNCPSAKKEEKGLDGVVETAKSLVGNTKYGFAYDIHDPNPSVIDCNGLIRWAYYQALGFDMEANGMHCTKDTIANAVSSGKFKEISKEQMAPGDIICGATGVGVSGYHTAMYAGNNECVESVGGGEGSDPGVQMVSLDSELTYYIGELHFYHYVG